MLHMDGVTKEFGSVRAVDSVTLSIDSGQMVGIIGKSGAGKSTLLRLINRLADPTRGTITFKEQRISSAKGRDLQRWRCRCAMIFQQFNLVNRLDVLTNVLIGRLAHHNTLPTLFNHFSRAEKVMAIGALQRLDMASNALQRADTLSGGQQQRVAIAKALVQEPEVVLADECIASLDPPNAAKVMSALKTINEEDGITIICNLHHLDTARTYCRRIIGMCNGRVVFDGPPESLTVSKLQMIYGTAEESEGMQTDIGFIAGGEQLPVTRTAVASA